MEMFCIFDIMRFIYSRKHAVWAGLILFLISCAGLSCKKDVVVPLSVRAINHDGRGDINKILFINDTLAYIVGGDRYNAFDILSTADGGNTWSLYHEEGGQSKAMYSVSSSDGRVYIAAYDGRIFIKPGMGAGWQTVQTAGWDWLQDILFTGPNTGYIVAGIGYLHGRVFHIDSLGTIAGVDSFDYELSTIIFPTPMVGYAGGYGAIIKTDNGGQSWSLLTAKGDFFKGLYALDINRVWAVGFNGSILYTSDGGRHWEQKRNGDNPLRKPYKLRAVLFKNETTGYIAGDKGLLLITRDGGKHWAEMQSFTHKDLRCLALHPDGSLWVGGSEGALFRIED